jgi:hypothetical protein
MSVQPWWDPGTTAAPPHRVWSDVTQRSGGAGDPAIGIVWFWRATSRSRLIPDTTSACAATTCATTPRVTPHRRRVRWAERIARVSASVKRSCTA